MCVVPTCGKMCVFIHNDCVMHFFCTPICTVCLLILNQGELIWLNGPRAIHYIIGHGRKTIAMCIGDRKRH